MAKRYFEYKDAKSKKFWEVSVSGKKVNIRYGKIGTDGQTSLKELSTPAEAKAHAEKQAAGKVKKGYKEAKVKAAKKAVKKKAMKKRARIENEVTEKLETCEKIQNLTNKQKEYLCYAMATAHIQNLISSAYANVFDYLNLECSTSGLDYTGDDEWLLDKARETLHGKLSLELLITALHNPEDFGNICGENAEEPYKFAWNLLKALPDDFTEEQFDALYTEIEDSDWG
jgi:predicted DNA-binding WGR domain protein